MVEIENGIDYRVYEEIKDGKKYTYSMVNIDNNGYSLLYEDLLDTNIKTNFSIEATVDINGEYQRLSIDTPSFERTIYTNGSIMIGDNICVKPDRRKCQLYGVVYCSDGINEEISVEDYLKLKPHYLNPDGIEYVPSFETSSILLDFISTNRTLRNQMALTRVPNQN